MQCVDPNWPVFVLIGLLVGETYYQKTLVPRVKQLKIKHQLAPHTVLHSREIRRCEGDFAFLARFPERKGTFYQDINQLFMTLRIRLFCVVIDKQKLRSRFLVPVSPYDVSLSQLLSLVCGPPGTPSPNRPNVTRIIAESRGRRPDKGLQHEYQRFRRIGLGSYGAPEVQNRKPRTVQRVFPERVDFVRKRKVVAGLELADLAAYPIGRGMVSGNWDNPAYQVVSCKLKELVVFP
jgi:hypothetical protein